MSHTPGPWKVDAKNLNGYEDRLDGAAVGVTAVGEPGWCIAAVWTDVEAVANNANLIAAAPDLLRALIRLCKSYPTDSDMQEAQWEGAEIEEGCAAYDAARAAIAKATGAPE